MIYGASLSRQKPISKVFLTCVLVIPALNIHHKALELCTLQKAPSCIYLFKKMFIPPLISLLSSPLKPHRERFLLTNCEGYRHRNAMRTVSRFPLAGGKSLSERMEGQIHRPWKNSKMKAGGTNTATQKGWQPVFLICRTLNFGGV